MTYQSYAIDVQGAKKATEGGRIEQTGKYIASIVRAEFVRSNEKKTEGIEFEIKTDGKNDCSFTVWTRKADGTAIMGMDKISALMACAGARTLTPTEMQLEKYDYDQGARVLKDCTVAKELQGVKLGWLLEREPYLNKKGEERTRMQLYANFNADSELVASEIIDRKTIPEELGKLMQRLINKPVKAAKGSSAPTHQTTPSSLDLDDDLPF
jgi:hypothetical protein